VSKRCKQRLSGDNKIALDKAGEPRREPMSAPAASHAGSIKNGVSSCVRKEFDAARRACSLFFYIDDGTLPKHRLQEHAPLPQITDRLAVERPASSLTPAEADKDTLQNKTKLSRDAVRPAGGPVTI
jgi:hypothetical protein